MSFLPGHSLFLVFYSFIANFFCLLYFIFHHHYGPHSLFHLHSPLCLPPRLPPQVTKLVQVHEFFFFVCMCVCCCYCCCFCSVPPPSHQNCACSLSIMQCAFSKILLGSLFLFYMKIYILLKCWKIPSHFQLLLLLHFLNFVFLRFPLVSQTSVSLQFLFIFSVVIKYT